MIKKRFIIVLVLLSMVAPFILPAHTVYAADIGNVYGVPLTVRGHILSNETAALRTFYDSDYQIAYRPYTPEGSYKDFSFLGKVNNAVLAYDDIFTLGIKNGKFIISKQNNIDTNLHVENWNIDDIFVLQWLYDLQTNSGADYDFTLDTVVFGYFDEVLIKGSSERRQEKSDLVDMLNSKDFIYNNFVDTGKIYSASKTVTNKKSFFEEQDDLNSNISTDKGKVSKFYSEMQKQSSTLNMLAWYYNHYVSPGSDIKAIAKDKNQDLPSHPLGKFLVFAINGTPLSPKKEAERRAQELVDAIAINGGATDVNNYSHWITAAIAMHEGYTPSSKIYTEDFLDLDNLNKLDDEEQAKILTILQLWNADLPADITYTAKLNPYIVTAKFKSAGKNYISPDSPSAIMTDSLNYINSLGMEDDSNYLYRMLTFEARLKYLVGACYNNGTTLNTQLPVDILNFYTQGNASGFRISPSIATVTIGRSSLLGGQFPVNNGEAYIYFVDTVTELYSMCEKVPTMMDLWLENGTISTQQKYVEGILSVYNGLRYIDSDEAWNLWMTPYDSNLKDDKPGDGPSLEDVYNKLLQKNAFENIGTGAVLETGEPLVPFFSIKEKQLSNYYLKGLSYSSTYIPMSTNVYDAYTLATYDEAFLNNFHYKYGFNRKALYIDTNAKAAVDLHNTARKGNTKVCTLRDLLSCDKDIVLYIDDNFYNVADLASLQGETLDRLDNVDADTDTREWWQKLWSKAIDGFEVDIYEQTKTSENTKYSDKLRNKIANEAKSLYYPEAKTGSKDDNKDQYVLTSGQINDYLDGTTTHYDEESDSDITTFDNYTVLQSYAVVSAIYRDKDLYKKVNTSQMMEPVFISSPDLACISGTSEEEKQTILNYLLLKNLKANIPVGYNYNLDMESPVYMDIYGNILTESGYVVVPAACNSTLYDDRYSKDLYNAGLFTVYGDDYSLPIDYRNVDSVMSPAFEKDDILGIWKVKSRMVDNKVADYARLTTGDKSVTEAVQKQFEYNLNSDIKMYKLDSFIQISLEVLRGAPLEYIDKDFEGLNINRRVSKAGLVAAAKLEELQNALDSGDSNAILSIPNLAFMDGIEYVAVFAFKVVFFLVLIILMFTVYVDAVGTQLSWRTLTKCIWILVLTVGVIITVPEVFQLTYYQSNRALLQNETSYIAMLNLEKQQSGVEIGIYDVSPPDIQTKLLLKLDDINVPWYDVFSKVMLSSTFDNLEEVYSTYSEAAPASRQPDITVMNDGIYTYVDDIFNSADVEINLGAKNLYLRTDETITTSFYSPYYVILEILVNQVNQYNNINNWYAYTTKTQKGGKLKTVGIASAYFNSVDFMNSQGDILNMNEVYGMQSSLQTPKVFSDDEISKLAKSAWHSTTMSNDQLSKRINKLSDYARDFVADNKSLLGKISDETFLKVMALSLSTKHNQLFGVQSADCYEIYNLSNDDLLRLSIGTKEQVLTNSTLTFSRFVYEVGGTPAVYAAAILSMITWVGSYIKPLATILVFLAIFLSIFIFKICLRKSSSNIYGYVITTLLLCGANLLHSVILKISMYLPYLGLAPTVCIILMSLLQLGYLYILSYITVTAFKEWRDLGYEKHSHNLKAVADKVNVLSSSSRQQGKYNTLRGNSGRAHKPSNNWEYYDRLVNKHKNKNRRRS